MAYTWPPTLPQGDEAIGYDSIESFPDRLLFTPTIQGPGKLRPRYTSAPANVSFNMVLTEAQVATLETFYNTTLVGGSLQFEWLHPRTGIDKYFRFQPGVVPTFQLLTPDKYRTTLHLQVMPELVV
ncbi:MAG: hypothetical protein KAS32_28300 [Candidatus Peribacteraceae bacterium]|nr:hypothetical protein [Candidatus Peribacteraceae bacterium]